MSINLSVTGTTVNIAVDDDGAGIEGTETESIFDPGTRGAAANDRRGAGLGLALARRLARSAGGEIIARSNDDGGHFNVRLPLA